MPKDLDINLVSGAVLSEMTPHGQVQAELETGYDILLEYGYTLTFNLILDGGTNPLIFKRSEDLGNDLDNRIPYEQTSLLLVKEMREKVLNAFNKVVAAMSEPLRDIPIGLNLPHSDTLYKVRRWRLENGI